MKTVISFLVSAAMLLTIGCSPDGTPDDDDYKPGSDTEIKITEFNPLKNVLLLDLSKRNGDATDINRDLYSAKYILDVSGVPFIVSDEIEENLDVSSMILFSSPLTDNTFTVAELGLLTEWVERGGVIISPACHSLNISPVFGVSGFNYSKLRYSLIWQEMEIPELEYFDRPEEKKISLGRETEGQVIKSYGYTVSTGEPIAMFDTGEPAVVKNIVKSGRTYLFGLEWRDVIQRPQLNKDFDAQRLYTNGFEPSADVFPLFVRSVWNNLNIETNGASVWKHTIPEGFSTVLIPTHDVDSKTGFDAMHYMSEFEEKEGVSAHYFITTRYFRDDLMSPFYNSESVEQLKAVQSAGHTIGSHSVGHFPDFNVKDRFPKGGADVLQENYAPYHTLVTGTTAGGSVYGEVFLSKRVLERDMGISVKSFRPGHLATNAYLVETLDESGYSFSSNSAAGDLLTSFPFWSRKGYQWENDLSSILEVPLNISDVFVGNEISVNNYPDKAKIWEEVLGCQQANFAPCVILIHPNRKWKMESLKLLVKSLDRSKCGIYNFEKFCDFWVQRENFNFSFEVDKENSIIVVSASKKDLQNNPNLGIIIQSPMINLSYVLIDEEYNNYPVLVKRISSDKVVMVR